MRELRLLISAAAYGVTWLAGLLLYALPAKPTLEQRLFPRYVGLSALARFTFTHVRFCDVCGRPVVREPFVDATPAPLAPLAATLMPTTSATPTPPRSFVYGVKPGVANG